MRLNTLALAALLATLGAHAEVLTPAEALSRAADLLPAKVGAERRAAALRSAEPILTVGDAQPEVYVFGSAAGGLLVASADSETTPLLGYSEEYVQGAEMPPSLQWLVNYYGQEIRARRNGDVVKRTLRRASRSDFDPIAPICKTQWGQGAPYCYDCPPDGDYYSVTGCVATAMAQVLKTYEYPARCSGGTFSYAWEKGKKTLSKNFDNVTLDWDNMLDTYSSSSDYYAASSQAVANLMSALGYASQMDYSSNGSGAQDLNCAQGLIRNFDYDYTLQYLYMDWYDLSDWQQMVYDELTTGHPVYYSGANLQENVGHAFVIDGYQADGYFHVNWGWNGSLDGYYLLTALDPDGEQGVGGSSGGYSAQSGAFFNLSPGKTMTTAEAPLTICAAKPLSVPAATKVGEAIVDDFEAYNYAPYTVPKVYFSLLFMNDNDPEVYYFTSWVGTIDLKPHYGCREKFSFIAPDEMSEGTYTVTRIAYNPNTGRVYDLYYDRGVNSRIRATVSGSDITFSEYTESFEETLFFDSVEFPSTIYFDEEVTLKFDFCNATQNPYTGRVYLEFCRKGTDEVVYSRASSEFSMNAKTYTEFTWKTKVAAGDLSAGEYIVRLACDDPGVYSGSSVVTVRNRPGIIQGSKFECTSTHINNIWFNIDLTALQGDYSGKVALAIAKNKTSSILWSDMIDLDLAEGETITKNYSEIDLTDKVTIGQSYIIYGLYVDENNKAVKLDGESQISFTVSDQFVNLNEIKATDAQGELFDLTGRRVESPTSTGVYIRRNGSNTQKIILR